MYILGISAFYHDSAACLIKDGKIVAASQEERFSRIKHDDSFPTMAVQFCLDFVGINFKDIEAVCFYDKPLLKFERILETYYHFAPKGIVSFLKSMPIWLKDKIFLKRTIQEELRKIGDFDSKKTKLLFTEHHLSHAASAFYCSNFEESAILIIDGVGEWATASVGMGTGNKIKILKELRFPHSLGLLYSAFTYFLGFKVNSGEYKLMGLAPYGNKDSEETKRFIGLIKTKLIDIKEDGSIWLDQSYFNYATGLKMIHIKKWEELFGIKAISFPSNEMDYSASYCNLAFAIQEVTEEIVVLMAKEVQKLTGLKNLCMAGGVALNCVANGKLESLKIFDSIYIQPAAGDAGGSIGAALSAYYTYYENDRSIDFDSDSMKNGFLGYRVEESKIQKLEFQFDANFKKYSHFSSLTRDIAKLLDEGKVIGWVQDRAEFGPRALGNRSILADSRNSEMQSKLNLMIKKREGFRPFAPIVKEEVASKYFEMDSPSPFMLMVHPLREEFRLEEKVKKGESSIYEKLRHRKSLFPAITHVDYSSRVQTVSKRENTKMYQLLDDFEALTGHPILVNTSFNVRGEPIVNTEMDAYQCFMNTEMDYLVINNFLFDKLMQPTLNLTTNFKLD